MAAEASLVDAARNAWPNIQPIWASSVANLAAALQSFANTSLAALPQQQDGAHPVINWLIQAIAVAELIDSGALTQDNASVLGDAVNPVYRACWIAAQLSSSELSNAQKTIILDAYNAAF